MLASPCLTGNCPAFVCSDDFLSYCVNLAVEVRDVLAELIAFRQRRASLSQCFPQRENPIHQRAFFAEQSVNTHSGVELRFAVCRAKFCATIQTDRQLR